MRRNFTQIIMSAALLVGFTTMGNAQCDPAIEPPAGAIMNWQFDGGNDGWTATNLAGDEVDQDEGTTDLDATVYGWVWDADGLVDNGNFVAAGTAIQSESVCNGAMVFDSDYYDNLATDVFNSGPCPSDAGFFCDGLLKSPRIDLSAVDTEVSLQFTQAVRQFNSEFSILLSNDGGVSYFDTIVINDDVATNTDTRLGETLSIPLCGMRGVADGQVTFWYRGFYYYWALDDVSIVPSNAPDIRVNSNFAAVTTNYGTPCNMLLDLPFLADIENVAAVEAIAPNLNVNVFDDSGTSIHSQVRTFDNVSGCMTDENKPFAELYAPSMQRGIYTVEYQADADGDVNPLNDVVSGNYEITESEFKKVISEEEAGLEYLSGIRYGGGSFQSWGSYFFFPDNAEGQAIEEIRAGVVIAGTELPGVGEIVCVVYQWIDVNGDGLVDAGAADEKIKLGEATYLLTPDATDFRDFSIVPLDEDGELIVPEPGAEILVVLHTNPFSGEINYFGLNSDAAASVSFATGASTLAYGELMESPRYGSFGGVGTTHDDRDEDRQFFNETRWTWYINARITTISCETSTEDINEDIQLSVYPSPASQTVNVELNLDELSRDVNIELVNMSGQKVATHPFKNIQNDVLSIDVSTLPGGMYLMNVRTEVGLISKKISVVH